jgi:hypothetical protein
MEPIRLQNRTEIPKRTSNRSQPPDYFDADEGLYPVKSRTSAVRYTDTQGNQVIERGNKRFVFHDNPPPRKRRRPHWLVISGLSMMMVLLLWAGLSWLTSWIANNQLNATYEYPRVSQADEVVYPGDTSDHPSHYLFLNLNGTVLIVELPHGDSAKSRIYKGPTLFSDNADQIPITGEFRTVNGKIEMLEHIQDRIILYINNGTQFIPQ